MRDHGGNIDAAKARFGGTDWIDLSTGINRQPYPLPTLPAYVWTDLPTQAAQNGLISAARAAYGTQAAMIALAGAQAAIQLIPLLSSRPAIAHVLAPTYNEHAAALRACGWQVVEVTSLAALEGADLAIIVNPNNPDGRHFDAAELLDLSKTVGRMVIDESFADACPAQSLVAEASDKIIVLRSFGKFWGLAGVRLGFAIAGEETIARMTALSGPWPVSGAAIEIGRIALSDHAWRLATTQRLAMDAARLDRLASAAGWRLVGGTSLFRTYETPGANETQARLGACAIWSRIFPYSDHWLRLGLPGAEHEWVRLRAFFESSSE